MIVLKRSTDNLHIYIPSVRPGILIIGPDIAAIPPVRMKKKIHP